MAQDAPAVNEPVAAEPTTTDSAPVENNSEVVSEDAFDKALNDDLPESKADTEDKPAPKETEPKEEVTEEQVESDETKPEDKPQGEEKVAPKSENRYQKLANDNRALRDEIERLTSQEARVANEQELLNEINPETGDYYTPQEVERIAFQQNREQQAQTIAEQRYRLEVQESQQTLVSDANKALQEFPEFDANSPDYNPELSAQVDQLLGANLVIDPNTKQVIGSRVSPYQLYQTVHMAQQASSAKGRIEGQKATEKMLANADSPSNSSSAKKETDPILAALQSD